MTDVERMLEDAGARWRAGQPPAPTFALSDLLVRASGPMRQGPSLLVGLAAAAVVVVLLGVFAFGRFGSSGPGRGSGGSSASGPVSTGSPPSGASTGRSPSASISPVPCNVTLPKPVYVPPKPTLLTPPAYYDSDWYGSARLWTMLDRQGESWSGWVYPPPYPQKTFWWSADWNPTEEPMPAITVTGKRLDRPGSFVYGPGTNASADWGSTAMLVGVDFPTTGCWELTARYRGATLSYVAEVADRP
jgi:hypothetical protein